MYKNRIFFKYLLLCNRWANFLRTSNNVEPCDKRGLKIYTNGHGPLNKIAAMPSLTPCCFVVYSTRRFVVCLSVCHFVLVFFSPFSIAITSLGEERANLSAFRTFVRFVRV